jgi:hypothetical protein
VGYSAGLESVWFFVHGSIDLIFPMPKQDDTRYLGEEGFLLQFGLDAKCN